MYSCYLISKYIGEKTFLTKSEQFCKSFLSAMIYRFIQTEIIINTILSN